MQLRLAIPIACVILTAGCGRQSVSSTDVATNRAQSEEQKKLDHLAGMGDVWVRNADVVVETVAVQRGSMRVTKPLIGGTSIVVPFGQLAGALGGLKGSNAVLIIPKYLDDENMTNAVNHLRQTGLTVHVVVEGWGRRFPGPEI
jgi:hypothetical protein